MYTEDFTTELFWRIDDAMRSIKKHSQANLYASEIVTLGFLFAVKGIGDRAFYRWVKGNYRCLFAKLPDRTRLFRLFAAHPGWTNRFLADPTILGVCDSYGIELLHPMREGRVQNRLARKDSRVIAGLSAANWHLCPTSGV